MKLLDVKEIVFEDGSKSAPLHSGLDGDILLGNFNSTKVAVKRFAIRNSTSISRFNKESTFLEIETLRNVLRPLGIVRQAPHYWIVFPYFPMGDLGKVSREDSRLSPALRILLCIDLCDALLSVHELGFVFRDLKTANILVDHNFHAKLTDFGSVQSVSKGLEVDTNEVGPSGGFHKRRFSPVYFSKSLIYILLCRADGGYNVVVCCA
jgi:serine/threonine protein kinase